MKMTMIEAYLFHEKKAQFVYHHEIRTKEIKVLYNTMFDDFDEILNQQREMSK
ncbi:hypothetical protein H0266_18445 [Halobacillus locisalis]|uniref:Uncharacterized protein n=1 Tax=Halobacillus locisalis TaxID=220753 RepID=A0A838CY69_9BACI|nr:hypothetical protein [Halobacillus locisalis]MBA2176863.1 hypothetical protein [Halobacillus locisalis]